MKILDMLNIHKYRPSLTYKSNQKWSLWCVMWATILSVWLFLVLSILMFTIDNNSFGPSGKNTGYNLIHKHQDRFNGTQEFDPLNNGWGIAFIFSRGYDPTYFYSEVEYYYINENDTTRIQELFGLTNWNADNFPEEMLKNLKEYSNNTYCPNYSSEHKYKFIGNGYFNTK